MYKGTYIAMTGAVMRSQELDSVANNLANASTAGYKKTSFSSRLYPLLEGTSQRQDSIYPDARAMTYYGAYHIDTSEGNIRTTGNPLDLAVKGDGFFAVESKGKTYYTRNGSFSMNKDGFMVTGSGQMVLDAANKPIRIAGKNISTANINIASDGNIYINGNVLSKLKLVNLNNIQHVGDSLFSGNETGASKGEILQGSLEMSNVNVVEELANLIIAQRAYDLNSKAVQASDEMLQTAAALRR